MTMQTTKLPDAAPSSLGDPKTTDVSTSFLEKRNLGSLYLVLGLVTGDVGSAWRDRRKKTGTPG